MLPAHLVYVFLPQTSLVQPGSPLPQPLPQLLNTSLMSCEPDLRIQLLSNVVVNGGGSLLVGFVDRLHNELVRHYSTVRPIFRVTICVGTLLTSVFADKSPCSGTSYRAALWRMARGKHSRESGNIPSIMDQC